MARMPYVAVLLETLLCIAGLCITNASAADAIGRGRQILLDRGLQVQAQVYAWGPGEPDSFDVGVWRSSNFTTLNVQWQPLPAVLARMPAHQQWGRWYQLEYADRRYLLDGELPYAANFASMQYDDDGLANRISDPNVLNDVTTAFRDWKVLYPNTLVFAEFNAYTLPDGFTGYTNYLRAARPDMLLYNHYPSYTTFSNDRSSWYSHMQAYRTAALAGYDGSGSEPLPYGQYLNQYRNLYGDPLPAESFTRLQQFGSWAFGYTFTSTFCYNDPVLYFTDQKPTMFSSPGELSPTAVFSHVAESNRESRNLGPALVRLVSTDIRMIPQTTAKRERYWDWGWKYRTVYTDAEMPDGVLPWSCGAQETDGYADYITGITPLGGVNAPDTNVHADVLIGYFRPLLEDDRTFADGLHFMIVNGATDGAAEEMAERYRLTFDFAGSTFDSLLRLSRDTGRVELVTLTQMADSTYVLDLTLPGGTGDLFRFWDSNNSLPAVPEPAPFVLMGAGAISLLATRCVSTRKNITKHPSKYRTAEDAQ